MRLFLLFFFIVLVGIAPTNFISAEEKIDINAAPKEELQKIIGVGPVIAQRIIDARPFSSINDLIRVSGIGEITLQKIIEQDLAWVGAPAEKPEPESEAQAQPEPQPEQKPPAPKITLSFPENNPVNKEIEVVFSAANLKNATYDVKISIEKEVVLSDIYNKNKGGWQSSHYYISGLFSSSSLEETFKLKIREEHFNFQGEADILARVREGGKSAYLEYKQKINLSEPKLQLENESLSMSAKDLAAVGPQTQKSSKSLCLFLIASGLAVFSGAAILTLKKNSKKEYNIKV